MASWQFWKRRPCAERFEPDEWQKRAAWSEDLRAKGWRMWTGDPPQCGLIEVIRYEWEGPRALFVDDIAPEMNIADLYWRECRGDRLSVQGGVL